LAKLRWQVSGPVVHRQMQGIGIMFRVIQPELFEIACSIRQMAPLQQTPKVQDGGLWQD
jgi:hypothetical protein